MLGVGLYIRDLELARFTDHEETAVPDYIFDSNMIPDDLEEIERVLQLISAAVHHVSGYVSCETSSHKY